MDDCSPQIYQSHDGGATWTSAPTDLTWLSFPDPLHGWGVAGSVMVSSGAIDPFVRTSDGGSTWTPIPSPCDGLDFGPIRAVAFRSTTSGMVVCALTLGAGGEFHAVLATTDGGAHWKLRASTDGTAKSRPVGRLLYGGYIGGIVEASDGAAWMAGIRMAPQASSDGGRTWTSLHLGDPDVNLVKAAWPLDATHGYAVMWHANRQATLLEVTTDGGRHWKVRASWPVHGSITP